MAVILEERGRGKFKPAPDYKVDEVKELLNKKIEEERQAFADCSEEIEFDKLNYDPNKWNLLSLFSGCGGLDLGFELAGLKAVMGEEVMEVAFADKKVFDENINNNVFNTIYVNDIFDEARETYAQNAGKYIYMDKSDIRKIKEFPKADIVLGGFPCPGFSEAGPRLVDDKRNFLYLHFIRCLMQSKPKIFVAENVKGMMTLGKGEVFKQIVQDFAAAGYTIYHKLLNSAEYGVPQIRERVILVGVRNDIDFEYVHPEPTHGYGIDGLKEVVTLRDAIGDLPECKPFWDEEHHNKKTSHETPESDYTWHKPRYHNMRDMDTFRLLAHDIESGKREYDSKKISELYEKKVGSKSPIHRYHVLEPDLPSTTIIAHLYKDGNRFIHYDSKQSRTITVREAARLQSFDDDFDFVGSQGNAYQMIGNAVPPKLAKAVGLAVADLLKRMEAQ